MMIESINDKLKFHTNRYSQVLSTNLRIKFSIKNIIKGKDFFK